MAIKTIPSANSNYRALLRDELAYCESLKELTCTPLDLNGEKLYFIRAKLDEVFENTKGMFSAFCALKKVDFSSQLKKETANDELSRISNAAHCVLTNVLGENHGIVISPGMVQWENPSICMTEVLAGVRQLLFCAIEHGAEKLGCRIINRGFQLNYKDAKTRKSKIAVSDHVECLMYSLYRLKETRAIDQIFHQKPLFPGRSLDEQLSIFIEWGYLAIDEPQRGDLIIYINEKGLLSHAGVMIDAKTVHSKWGMSTDGIIEHPISSVPPMYGDRWMFLRKEPCTLDEPWIL